jgi:CBS domain containing-hemolysin-like protein
MEFLVIVFSVFFSAFFSGMEIAFLASNKLRIEMDRKKGKFPSGIIAVFVSHPGQFIATMLVGNNISLVVYGIFMAIILKPLLIIYFSSEISILMLQTILSTIIILFTAEFLPKAIFRINPNQKLNFFAIPVFLFYMLLYPVAKFSIWISNNILRGILKVDITENISERVFGKIDLDNLIREAKNEKSSAREIEHEIRIFRNALEFSDVRLRDCMVPRTEIVAMDENESIENLTRKFIETGLSRILIYKDNIDNIIGYVTSHELFKNPKSIKSRINSLPIVPESMSANKTLELFMKEHKNLALVVDEFGGTSGMVTIEDIIEEIFGEIEDEHDSIKLIDKQISSKEFLFSGRMEIDYLNEKYQFNIPESDEYNTLAGLVLAYHQQIPEPETIIFLENYKLRVVKVTETRIELISLVIFD